MGFQEQFELTQNAVLRQKVRMAVILAANLILADPARETEHRFCHLIIREPTNEYWLTQIMYSIVIAEQVSPESTDDVIKVQVNGVFGKHALANANI